MRRAIVVCLVCVVVGVVVQSANAASESLKDLQLMIVKVVPSGSITVRMANTSHKKPLRVWTEANSWGALRWKVVIIRDAKTLTVFQDPDGVGFTRNIPQFDTIATDDHIDRQLNLNNVNREYWSKLGERDVRFQSGDRVVVIYDVPPENEAKEMHVWYGVAASSTVVK
jgi:outer membrane lipoprotein-sorting protein